MISHKSHIIIVNTIFLLVNSNVCVMLNLCVSNRKSERFDTLFLQIPKSSDIYLTQNNKIGITGSVVEYCDGSRFVVPDAVIML